MPFTRPQMLGVLVLKEEVEVVVEGSGALEVEVVEGLISTDNGAL